MTAAFMSISLFIWAVGLMITYPKSNVMRRLGLVSNVYDKPKPGEENSLKQPEKLEHVNRQDQIKSFFESYLSDLEEELSKTDLLLRPKEYMMMVAIFSFILGGISLAATHSLLVGILGLIFAMVGSKLFLRLKKIQRLNKMNQQLVDTVNLISNGLKAGYSFLQAAEMVTKDGRPPISMEFKKMIRQMSMGMPTEDALKKLGERMESPDMDLVITAILIQRQVGGNLAEVLDKISDTIQGRIKLKGEIKTKTSQGKMSGVILVLLTPGIAVMISLINPEFIGALFTEPLGWVMIGISLFLQIIGIMAIKKIVNIEV
jgi:tight adherence protein B